MRFRAAAGRRDTRPGLGAAPVVLAVATVVLVTGCGSSQTPTIGAGGLRVTFLSLTPTTGFPGPPTDIVTVRGGRELARIVRLLPARLPRPPSRSPAGSTVCFPMDLTIGLSNGQSLSYPSCSRPRALRRVVAALCPVLRKPGFCFRFRNELD
jgi:hypothetical protein